MPVYSQTHCQASQTLYPLVEKFLIVVPVVVGVAQVPITFLTYKLHGDFGWLIYQQLGADLWVRRMHLYYEVSAEPSRYCLVSNPESFH